ncbi:hypothetical protein niasHT_007536 [Heterodera trifolii]|uniref:Cytoplasmic tRNA 2-thiolation protein 1 n=1 Tax=Heterodera trifolii TaxID=157864 RepID=A0ABD2LPV5_9BILA
MVECSDCSVGVAKVKTAKDGLPRCSDCFIHWFEKDVHEAIERMAIFTPGDRIGIGVSGGKDSTVLAHVLSRLNKRHSYGLQLVLLCVDEGIKGYRDDSIREVQKNEADLCLPLTITSYRDLYGWTMDEIVAKIGRRNNCTFCGALDRAALRAGCNKLATGHNADDAAETVLMNFLRGDIGRLQRMGAAARQPTDKATTKQLGNSGSGTASAVAAETGDDESLPRVKPMKYAYEKDIVIYAHFGKLNYFSTECIYAPNAYRSNVRSFVKELERVRPRAILDLVLSGESLRLKAHVSQPKLGKCERCGYIASQKFCKACQLLDGLNDETEDNTKCQKGLNSATRTNKSMDEENTKRIEMNNCGGRTECGCNKTDKSLDF